jgi:MazG family protein
MKTKAIQEFEKLIEIIDQLRGPDGCPWDKEQDQKSLVQYAIEESFELAEAIETQDQVAVKDELGDFLFQVVLQAKVAQDNSLFDLSEVIQNLNEKMIRRHPHVFNKEGTKSISEIWDKWEKIKTAEKSQNPNASKKIFNYPKSLPALQAANKIGVKTERYRFDWPNVERVFEKLDEEITELKEALPSKDLHHIEHEIGDVLFVVCQIARHLKIDPEQALRGCNRRFERRFSKTLQLSQMQLEDFVKLPEEKKEAFYIEAKKILKDSE